MVWWNCHKKLKLISSHRNFAKLTADSAVLEAFWAAEGAAIKDEMELEQGRLYEFSVPNSSAQPTTLGNLSSHASYRDWLRRCNEKSKITWSEMRGLGVDRVARVGWFQAWELGAGCPQCGLGGRLGGRRSIGGLSRDWYQLCWLSYY